MGQYRSIEQTWENGSSSTVYTGGNYILAGIRKSGNTKISVSLLSGQTFGVHTGVSERHDGTQT